MAQCAGTIQVPHPDISVGPVNQQFPSDAVTAAWLANKLPAG